MLNSSLQPTPIPAPKIAIIGAGLTGLFTATLLERASSQMNEQKINDKSSIPEITIFEKSRSVGRLATRYRSDSLTDKTGNGHLGRSFLPPRAQAFNNLLNRGCRQVCYSHGARK